MQDDYTQRSNEFGDAFQSEEIFDVERLIIEWGRLGERLVMDPTAVDHAMKALFSRMTGQSFEAEAAHWVEVLENSHLEAADFQLSQLFTSLHAYAFHGLDPDTQLWVKTDTPSISAIEWVVRQGRDVLDAVPEPWQRPEGMEKTVLAAEGRLALDSGRGLSIEQFAALGRIGLRTAKNLLMPSSPHRLLVDEEGLIPAAEALVWLEKRGDFRGSIWDQREQADDVSTDADDEELEDEILFLPVARDGSWFDPVTCRRNGVYIVGPKGKERSIEDYRAALGVLKTMSTPRWRRPNEKGHWGIVRGEGERWLRRTARELGLDPTTAEDADRRGAA
jgi:hypothetical protein